MVEVNACMSPCACKHACLQATARPPMCARTHQAHPLAEVQLHARLYLLLHHLDVGARAPLLLGPPSARKHGEPGRSGDCSELAFEGLCA